MVAITREDLGWECKVTVAGDVVVIRESDEVRDVLRKETEKRGIDSFDVFIDGQEIEDSDDLPATFEGLAIVEVRRSVKAGN